MSRNNQSKLLPPVCFKGHAKKLRPLSQTTREKPLPPSCRYGTPVVHLQIALALHWHLQGQIMAISMTLEMRCPNRAAA